MKENLGEELKMSVKQISVFLENKIGRLAEITALLEDKNIKTLSLYRLKNISAFPYFENLKFYKI